MNSHHNKQHPEVIILTDERKSMPLTYEQFKFKCSIVLRYTCTGNKTEKLSYYV